jgi:hypothetical protein
MPYVINESHLVHDIGGAIIGLATKSDVQHIATITLDKDGNREWRYEALVGDGYVKRKWNPRVNVVERKVWVPQDKYDSIIAWADRTVGTKYPPVAYLGLEYLLPFLRHHRRTIYCSQAGLKWLEMMGYYDNNESLIRPSPGACDAAWLTAEKLINSLVSSEHIDIIER